MCTSSDGKPRAAKATRLRAEFSRRDSQIDDLLDEVACAQDHFVEVEPGELRKIPHLRLHNPADPRESVVPHAPEHSGRDGDEEVADRSFVGMHQRFGFGELGDDLGAHHLAKQRVFGIEIEVDRALADSGDPRDVVDLGSGESDFTEDRLSGIENLIGALIGAALPAGLAGGGKFGGVCGHLTAPFSN